MTDASGAYGAAVSEEPLRVYTVGAITPESYANLGQRAYTEESCRRELLRRLRIDGLSLLDSAVGKWEKREQGFRSGDVWTRWEYRLEGYAVPTSSAPSEGS